MLEIKSFRTLVLILAPVLLLIGCEKNITIPQPSYNSRVTIQCSLEPGTVPKLYFYRTVPYFDKINTSLHDLFIKDALVEISDADTTDYLFVDSTYNFIKCEFEYFYTGSIQTRENRQYKLEITRDTSYYTATTTTNLRATTIDSVGYTSIFKDIYGEHEGVISYFRDLPNQSDYYRYEMTRMVDTTMRYREGKLHSPCIGSDSIIVVEFGRSVYDDVGASGEQMKLVIEPAYSHRKGLAGVVRIETIDKATYDFLYQLDRQKLGQLNPFVEPVFLTNGQFGSKALGYFGSIKRSNPVDFVFPE